MENIESIGQRIKQVRGELSQKAFGTRIGLSQTAVTALENNQSEPRLGTFNSILANFGVNSDWLRLGTGSMKGRAAAEAHSQPADGPTTSQETVSQSETLIQLARAEALVESQASQLAAQAVQIERLWAELGKSGGSPEPAACFRPFQSGPYAARREVVEAC